MEEEKNYNIFYIPWLQKCWLEEQNSTNDHWSVLRKFKDYTVQRYWTTKYTNVDNKLLYCCVTWKLLQRLIPHSPHILWHFTDLIPTSPNMSWRKTIIGVGRIDWFRNLNHDKRSPVNFCILYVIMHWKEKFALTHLASNRGKALENTSLVPCIYFNTLSRTTVYSIDSCCNERLAFGMKREPLGCNS